MWTGSEWERNWESNSKTSKLVFEEQSSRRGRFYESYEKGESSGAWKH